ncbi:MAG: YXWGXW repeat-containing protein [Planctomycetes bacterium]|nr:YXWGXW repeat-containing protein [Planctomycetota bacterium]
MSYRDLIMIGGALSLFCAGMFAGPPLLRTSAGVPEVEATKVASADRAELENLKTGLVEVDAREKEAALRAQDQQRIRELEEHIVAIRQELASRDNARIESVEKKTEELGNQLVENGKADEKRWDQAMKAIVEVKESNEEASNSIKRAIVTLAKSVNDQQEAISDQQAEIEKTLESQKKEMKKEIERVAAEAAENKDDEISLGTVTNTSTVLVTRNDVPQTKSVYVYVDRTPPPRRIEVRSIAPSYRHRWVSGYWRWNGGSFSWVSGYWTLPPSTGSVWISPTYVKVIRGSKPYYRCSPGYWTGGSSRKHRR